MKRKVLLLFCALAFFCGGYYFAKVSRLLNPNHRFVGITNSTDCKLKRASIVLPSRTITLEGPQIAKYWRVDTNNEDRTGIFLPVLGLGRIEYQVEVELDSCSQNLAEVLKIKSGKYIDVWLVDNQSNHAPLPRKEI